MLILSCGLSAFGSTADGSAKAAQQPRVFDIPSEPLAAALQTYSQDTGVGLFYESEITAGLKSPALKGRFTPKAALRALLAGTGFIIQYNRDDAVSLSTPQSLELQDDHSSGVASLSLPQLDVRPNEEGMDDALLRDFGAAVQAQVTSALTKDAEIRSGNYRIRVKLWIDPSNTISRAEVAQTTGDRGRDAEISTLLQGLTISRAPPAGMPQPVRIVISVGSP
ncbi:MAG: STN domain-containing protein [Pseudomonadota bacterium]